MTVLDLAVYQIQNKQYGGYLAFSNGYYIDNKTNSAWVSNGTPDSIDLFKQLWLAVWVRDMEVNGNYCYRFRCVQNAGNLTQNTTQTFGYNSADYVQAGRQPSHDPDEPGKGTSDNTQEWLLEHQGGDDYVIRHRSTSKVLDAIPSGDRVWCGTTSYSGANTQIWTFDRRSRGQADIDKVMKETGSGANVTDDISHYPGDAAYITLPESVRQEIWNKSLLDKQHFWRNSIFDCDDFAIVMKGEVAKWASNNLRADHVSILMGILWGSKGGGGVHAAHAFNFYLSQDLKFIRLYEPQQGNELDSLGEYKCNFALY